MTGFTQPSRNGGGQPTGLATAAPARVSSAPSTLPEGAVARLGPGPSARRTVSAVIPVKNEERAIAWVLERMPGIVDEIIVVDGHSTDATVEIARSTRPDVVVISDPMPGKGHALRAGFGAARSSVIVMLDGNGSMDPAEITRLVKILESGYDLVKGSRFMAGGAGRMTPIGRLGNRGLLGVVNVAFHARFSDLHYGFCAFRRTYLKVLGLEAGGPEIEAELVLRAWTAGLRVSETPSVELTRGVHRHSPVRPIGEGRRILETAWRERTRGRRLART
jgi:glycosyltransferase involved in cell wall biosynthesis